MTTDIERKSQAMVLYMCLCNVDVEYRPLLIDRYIQRYGSIPNEIGEKIKVLLRGEANDK